MSGMLRKWTIWTCKRRLREMTEARDVCKRQTAEANARHAETRQRLGKTREAWAHEKKRADDAEAALRDEIEAHEFTVRKESEATHLLSEIERILDAAPSDKGRDRGEQPMSEEPR